MNNKVNILCLKGFISIDNINKNYVYINKNNELLTVIHNMKHYQKNFLVKLATGTSLRLHPEAIVSGSILEKDIIKNDIETAYISKYKPDDYIYTPFKELEYGAIKTTIKLATGPKRSLEYFNRDLNTFCKDKGLTLKEFYSELDNSEETSTNLIDRDVTSKMSSEIKVNKELIDFLTTTLLRGKLVSETFNIVDKLDYKSKRISYRIKKDNALHIDMFTKMKAFFRIHSIKIDYVEYDHYFYINIYNSILYDYIQKFKLSFLREVLEFEKEFQIQFLDNIFKNTNNNFYTNPDTYHTLKELCYNNKRVISFVNRSNNSKSLEPICSSQIDNNASELEIYPDVVHLGTGYLTRIVDIVFCDKKQRVIKDYLIIG